MGNLKTNNIMNDFNQIKSVVLDDSNKVDDLIRDNLNTDVALISKVSEYIINSGGKRIRPLIVLLVSHALSYKKENAH